MIDVVGNTNECRIGTGGIKGDETGVTVCKGTIEGTGTVNPKPITGNVGINILLCVNVFLYDELISLYLYNIK